MKEMIGKNSTLNASENPQGTASQYVLTVIVGLIIVCVMREYPQAALLSLDFLFALFLFSAFTHKWRILFFVHPVMVAILGAGFESSFLDLGDGPAYCAIARDYGVYGSGSILATAEELGYITTLKFLSVGFIPVYDFVNFTFTTPSPQDFYTWQMTLFAMVMSGCVVIAKKCGNIADNDIFIITLFALVSPSFFELLIAPTRHYLTFISIWLFYISFMALNERVTIARIVTVLCAVILVAASKFAYFIPLTIFVSYFIFFEKEYRSRGVKIAIVIFSMVLGGLFLAEMIPYYEDAYREESLTGGNTFSGYAKLPIFGYAVKFGYALLSPFPWSKAAWHIETIYGGNSLAFAMHVLSSLTGIYFIMRLLLHGIPLLKEMPQVRPLIIFGGIISLAVLNGAIGYHGYLSIIFPFFSPLLLTKEHEISMLWPVSIAVAAELLYYSFY